MKEKSKILKVSNSSNNKKNPNKKWQIVWKYIVGAGVVIGIFIGIAKITEYNFKNVNENSHIKVNYFDIAVFVHGSEGEHDQILTNKGKVVMKLKTDKRDEPIGDKGEVNFKQLPHNFKNQQVNFYITETNNEPYQVTHLDSLYTLFENKPIYLEVTLANLDKIEGVVRDKENNFEKGRFS